MSNKINLNKLKTVSIKHRKSKVSTGQFPKLGQIPKDAFKYLFNLIPDINFGKNFKNLIESTVQARKKRKPIIFTFGAHVIKCGLAPIVIDLLRRGYITFLATNGASLIHDFEIAYCGNTSEYVDKELKTGNFGITGETANFVNKTVKEAAKKNKGIGKTAGKKMNSAGFKYRNLSIFAQAYNHNVPVTVHAAIGTDVVYQHASCDAASWGKASYADFLKLCGEVKNLNNGGILLNFGSAVILPEIFLKAINICRNLGYKVEKFTSANFDMFQQYRPLKNIVTRPTAKGGHGYNFIGYHELMLPLLYLCLTSIDE
jgi:hypothetical protein